MTEPIDSRLLSVNVGMPRDVPWRGRTVRTGIWKIPVQGRRRVTRLNVEGDGQGDRDGQGGEQRAVFVCQVSSYQYWQEQLNRVDLVYGQFGENFTVAGLADDEVCIGGPLSNRDGPIRSHAAARYLLSDWHPDGSSQDGVPVNGQWTAWVLFPRP